MLAASSSPVITADHLDTLEPQQMRAALLSLMGELAERDGVIARQGQEAVFKQAQIDKLTHENALLKRMKFAAQSERFSAEQKSLLDESLDEDLQAVADEIEQATPPVAGRQDKQVPTRATTGSRTRFGRLPLAATTGSLRAAYELVRGQQPS